MSDKPVTIAEIVERYKEEIADDIAEGVIPPTVSSFSELHDYVDANMYADDYLVAYEAQTGLVWLDYINTVQDAVDEWLKSGRPTEGM